MSLKKEPIFEQRQMSRKLTTKFLEEYRNNPCLWNTKCKEYNDRKLKVLGYLKLINLLKPTIPEVDKDFIVKKVNTLRSCFRKEYKKVLESLEKSTKNPYKPSLWYYNLLLFTVEKNEKLVEKNEKLVEKNETIFQILEDECTNLIETNNQQEETEEEKDDNLFVEIELAPEINRNFLNKNNKRFKIEPERSFGNYSTQVIRKSTDTSILALSNSKEEQYNNSQQDEFDAFGFLVASKLRKVGIKNENQQLFCENIINQALMKGLLGKLTENSVIDC